jgi:WD40 repeat protein
MAGVLLDRAGQEEGRPDLRGWEYQYLRSLCSADLFPGMRHGRAGLSLIDGLAISPDGRRAATTVGLHYGETDAQGRNRSRAPGEVCIWDLEMGRCAATIEHPSAVDAVAFSPDGRLLAFGGASGGVRLMDLKTTKEENRPPPVAGEIYGLAFAPRGLALAIASSQALVLWDLAAKEKRLEVAHPGWFRTRIAFHPGGRLLLAGSRNSNGVRGWNPETGVEVPLPRSDEPTTALALRPDGTLAARSHGTEIEIRNTEDWRIVRRLTAHTDEVAALAFAPDGRLASGSLDRSIRLWDATGGQELMVLRGHTQGVLCVGFTPDGRRLVSADQDKNVKVWDVTRHPEGLAIQVTRPGMLGERMFNLAFTDDGTALRTVDGASSNPRFRVCRWDIDDGRLQREGWLTPLGGEAAGVSNDVCITADGRWLAGSAAGEPGVLRVCDAETTREVCTIRTQAASAKALAISGDGRLLAYLAWGSRAGGDDRHTELAVADNTGSIKVRLELASGRNITSMCFTADGRMLAGTEGIASDRRGLFNPGEPWDIVFWETATLRERRRFPRVERTRRACLALSPSGDRLATVDSTGAVRFWQPETGRLTLAAITANSNLTGLAYSPDGRRLAVAGTGSRVRLYDALSGHELLQLRCLSGPDSGLYGFVARVVFSPDGSRIAANAWDGKVTIWSTGRAKADRRAEP